jgi:HSP20 family protein
MNNLVKRNEFWPATSTVDQFLNDTFLNWRSEVTGGITVPKTNIAETDDEFLVEMAAPGMKREDFNVELDNDTLRIWSEAEDTNEEKKGSYTRREFSYRSFNRSFHLPNSVEADKIRAKYEDGLLRPVF